MAAAEQEQDRSEPATPFRLKEARERGTVAKSMEPGAVCGMLAFAALLCASGPALFERQLRLDAALLSQAHQLGFSEAAVADWLSAVLVETLWLLAPVLAVVVVAGVLGTFAQTGPVFSLQPLQPDPDRLNPVSGLKRMLTARLLFEAGKSLVKLALLGGAIAAFLADLLPALLALGQTDPRAYGAIGLDLGAGLVLKLSLVLLAIALVDAGFARWEYLRKLRMSRREVREELKRREGDPKIRARIRELRNEMRKRARALKRVPEADVVITNPQHLAIALVYRRETMQAPEVAAKGAGDLAQRMKALARRHGVPMMENRPLARALFVHGRLEAPIPAERYAEVARVLAWAYALRALRREGGRA
jgi:flagellar biosynthetic protein FlhB